MWDMKRAIKVRRMAKDMQGYMDHLAYLTMHAITAITLVKHIQDRGLRDTVKEKGVKWFKLGDQELWLLCVNFDNLCALHDTRSWWFSRSRGACCYYNYNGIDNWSMICVVYV